MKKSFMNYGLLAAALLLIFALPALPALADLRLELGEGVKEKLEPLGTIFTLDWGVYRNT